ncbi:hypothetical protein [Methylibium sp. T29]|uniref:hypothetical protein n=1 Tax=Methylibium sp. T29 TaxID=1430884 RepID=UPI0003F42B1A|nr:hypothetical protein [Methylibium sp. T29]EWS57013.1 hypothetical protein X551_00147 [Methylibium sp. T29]EWS62211.1 hypothetical protein Y694_00054 [Methylibium sp. T29-B]
MHLLRSVATNVAIPLRPALSGLPRRQTPCLGDHFYDWPAPMPMTASANPENLNAPGTGGTVPHEPTRPLAAPAA